MATKNGNFNASENRRKSCQNRSKKAEFVLNCLAFRVKFYYNRSLYNVVGPWLMQGLAKLRKVAEVNRTGFNYLKLPHLANSKGTIVVK
jgi:hypothetical protein